MKYRRNLREIERGDGFPVRIVGLTGGIGSGKSVATSALKAHGYTVIDADDISRAMFGRGTSGETELFELFKQTAYGPLDRKRLRELISTDKKARVMLNEFTHPRITAEIARQINFSVPPVVLSAPLLFESALARLCDKTVCVYCPREIRIARITARDGVSRQSAENIIDAQIPDTERCTLSDFIIPSDTEKSKFEEEIVELFDVLFSRHSPCL